MSRTSTGGAVVPKSNGQPSHRRGPTRLTWHGGFAVRDLVSAVATDVDDHDLVILLTYQTIWAGNGLLGDPALT